MSSSVKLPSLLSPEAFSKAKGEFGDGNEATFCLGSVGQFTKSSHSFPVEEVSSGFLVHLIDEQPKVQVTRQVSGFLGYQCFGF